MQLSIKQKEFIRESANYRWAIKHGATRSGKTFLDYYLIPMRIRERMGKDGLVVLLGNTKGTLQRNVIDPMQKIWGFDCISDIKSDNTAMIFGEQVYCLGADNKKHVDRLRGSSIKYCYGDEVVTWNEEVFGMLKSRLDKPYSHFDGTCNPKDPNHWVKQFLDSDADVFSQRYCIDDNTFLNDKVKEEIKREHTGVFYQRYILGEWVLAEGLVYPNFSEEKNVVSELPFIDDRGKVKRGTEFYVSCDYGIVNPFSAHIWAVYDGFAYAVKEYYYNGRDRQQRTDEEHYDALQVLIGDINIQAIIIDPSASSFKQTIKRRGDYSVLNAKNEVIAGISTTASLLDAGRIKIHESCENLIDEFGMYSWDESAAEDAVIKEYDHAMDDMRYFAHTILRKEFGWLDWNKA